MKNKLYKVGAYEKAFPEGLSVSEMLRISHDCNYDYFEISIDRTEKRISRLYSDDFVEKCSYASKENEIPIGSMCLSALSTYTIGNPNEEISNRAMNILKRAIIFSARLGIRVLQIPGCDVPKNEVHTSESKEKYVNKLTEVTEMASVYGICLAIENMEDEFMDTVEKSMEYVNLINSPYLQVYPDSGNCTSASKKYHNNLEQDLLCGIGHCVAFHLKETRPDKYGGLFYGEGHVDFQSIVNYAWKLGARRYVMEYWYTGNELWKKDLLKANAMCRTWLDSAMRVVGE